MKNVLSFILVLVIVGTIVSCDGDNKPANILVGKYLMKTEEDDLPLVPSVRITEEKIIFIHTPYSSYLNVGDYTIIEDELVMVTDDDLYKYVFMINGNSLFFIEEKSSELPPLDERIGVSVVNNSEFIFLK